MPGHLVSTPTNGKFENGRALRAGGPAVSLEELARTFVPPDSLDELDEGEAALRVHIREQLARWEDLRLRLAEYEAALVDLRRQRCEQESRADGLKLSLAEY